VDINADGSKAIVFDGGAFAVYTDTSNPGLSPQVISDASAYTQLNMNPDFTKFLIANRNALIIKYYFYTGAWSNKNPISGSPSVLCYSISSDFSILAYIDNNNDVYMSKYDAASDMYINPTKVILNTAINNKYNIKLSPDGTILTLYKSILYIYKYNQGVYEYAQQLTFIYANKQPEFVNVFISISNTRIMTVSNTEATNGGMNAKLVIFEGYKTF
jgi:hypothetical protein